MRRSTSTIVFAAGLAMAGGWIGGSACAAQTSQTSTSRPAPDPAAPDSPSVFRSDKAFSSEPSRLRPNDGSWFLPGQSGPVPSSLAPAVAVAPGTPPGEPPPTASVGTPTGAGPAPVPPARGARRLPPKRAAASHAHRPHPAPAPTPIAPAKPGFEPAPVVAAPIVILAQPVSPVGTAIVAVPPPAIEPAYGLSGVSYFHDGPAEATSRRR